MTQICRKMFTLNFRCRFQRRLSILKRCIRCVLDQLRLCSLGKPVRYRVLPSAKLSTSPHICDSSFSARNVTPVCHNHDAARNLMPVCHNHNQEMDSDLVALKISLLGDCHIGKTSFLAKYVGQEKEQEIMQMQGEGLRSMDKTFLVEGARISYRVWEVDGDEKSRGHIPVACKDSVAILFMFDLTSRCTLNSVIKWYQQARKWNQTAIPVLIGTKFDDFIQLPIDLQWTIASQARAYAKALNGTLFFSSATYNINVNKIFKFITARLFDLPWTVERNLTIGEPIIDF